MDGDYHTFMDYPVQFSLPGIIVPQHVFNPSLRLPPKEPVRFVCNGKLGIRLSDALNARYAGLQNHTQQRALMPDGAPVFTFTIHVRLVAVPFVVRGYAEQPPPSSTVARIPSVATEWK